MALAFFVAGGCACSRAPKSDVPSTVAQAPSPNLVLPSAELAVLADYGGAIDSAAWEFSRNDEPLDVSRVIYSWQLLEVRQREYLNVVNGQPGEFSTVITRSTKRALSR